MSFIEKAYKWTVRLYKALTKAARTWRRTLNPCLRPHRPYLPWLWWKLTTKHRGSTMFTVVTPVYNTGRYLDVYFKSLTRQTLDFRRHLHIIMVDDGSTDNSVEVIKKWQNRYPENIEYIHQENQGINQARNKGIPRASTPWITWIDSNDFIHPQYFYEIDKALKQHGESKIVMLASRQITYDGNTRRFKNNRPFNRFFTENETLLPHNDLEDSLHFSVSSAVFSVDEIHRQGICFAPASGWPCFGDAHFVIRYLAATQAGHVLFCRLPLYYYRKYRGSAFNLDAALTKKQTYIALLEEGYLDLLKYFTKKYAFVPKWVQNSVLYAMGESIRQAVKSPKKVAHFSPKECDRSIKLAEEIFSYIDLETIYNFPHKLNGFTYPHKMGVCHAFKGEDVQSPYVYITSFDHKKGLLKFQTYSSSLRDTMIIFFDGVPVEPVFSKTVKLEFLKRTFIYQHYQWVKFNAALNVEAVTCSRGDVPLTIDLEGSREPSVSCEQISVYFARNISKVRKPSLTKPWLLMDRDILADDNAEHLYRYIMKYHPEQAVCFAVRKSSPCWRRLKQEGFHLVDFGSLKYEKIRRQTPKFISSHMRGSQFICLQHGVTKDDVSSWLNGKTINLFITATPQEYDSIVRDGSPYKMCKKEVALTGFPRHDALLSLASSAAADAKKIVLIMPTWREYLTGAQKGKRTHVRELLPDFFDSTYAKAWLGLLHSDRLTCLAERYGFKIVFFPHFGMQEYFQDLTINPAIEILTHSQTGIQHLFAAATFMVTDYSSVAFEMAFLQKAVLYYQFDEDMFFKGDHVYTKGYFEYRRDGFGPVCTHEAALLEEVEILMARGGRPQDIYLTRMESAFPIRDGKNCERVYQAIKALDVPA